MSKYQWHQGGDDHKDFAEWMMYRACEVQGLSNEYADMAWDDDTTRGFWMSEAWATLVWIYDRTNGDTAPAKMQDPAWKVPHLCPDGIHDFRLDEATGLTYCGGCDWWSPTE